MLLHNSKIMTAKQQAEVAVHTAVEASSATEELALKL